MTVHLYFLQNKFKNKALEPVFNFEMILLCY